MKKIFLMLALVMTVSVASAWEKRSDEGVVVLATKHLSPEAKSMVEKYLGSNYYDDVFYLRTLEAKKQTSHSKELRFLHLAADLTPVGVEGEDALKGIEPPTQERMEYLLSVAEESGLKCQIGG